MRIRHPARAQAHARAKKHQFVRLPRNVLTESIDRQATRVTAFRSSGAGRHVSFCSPSKGAVTLRDFTWEPLSTIERKMPPLVDCGLAPETLSSGQSVRPRSYWPSACRHRSWSAGRCSARCPTRGDDEAVPAVLPLLHLGARPWRFYFIAISTSLQSPRVTATRHTRKMTNWFQSDYPIDRMANDIRLS